MSLLDTLVARTLPVIPRPIVWRVARRYIAGFGLDDAARVIAGLKRRGLRAPVDILDEDVATAAETHRARDAYRDALARLERDDLPAGVSVKLSQLGLRLDPQLARENLEELAKVAASCGRFLRV